MHNIKTLVSALYLDEIYKHLVCFLDQVYTETLHEPKITFSSRVVVRLKNSAEINLSQIISKQGVLFKPELINLLNKNFTEELFDQLLPNLDVGFYYMLYVKHYHHHRKNPSLDNYFSRIDIPSIKEQKREIINYLINKFDAAIQTIMIDTDK